MNTENKQELYRSPEVKEIEVKARQVICGSGNGSYPGFTNDDTPYGF